MPVLRVDLDQQRVKGAFDDPGHVAVGDLVRGQIAKLIELVASALVDGELQLEATRSKGGAGCALWQAAWRSFLGVLMAIPAASLVATAAQPAASAASRPRLVVTSCKRVMVTLPRRVAAWMRQSVARRALSKRDSRSAMTPKATNRWFLLLVLLFAGGGSFAGCSEDDEDEVEHAKPAPDCQAIGDVCTHGVVGELADECHGVYHHNDADECAARKKECVDFCSSQMGEGGGSGAEH